MIRNLKALGLALIALGALGAVMASGASAAGERFHCEKAPCIITGESEAPHVFAANVPVTCSKAFFKGTQANLTETTQEVHPTYSGCEFLEEPATVDTNECDYVFESETTAAGHLPVSIKCTGSSKISVTTSACNLSFGSQANTGGIKVVNGGSGTSRDTTVTSTTGATFTKAGPFCFLVSGTTGTYSGPTTTKCYEDKGISGPVDLDTTTYTEGLQVGCWWE
jgi:hypothetical protein